MSLNEEGGRWISIEYITLSQSYYHIDVIFTISCDDNEGSFVRTIQY